MQDTSNDGRSSAVVPHTGGTGETSVSLPDRPRRSRRPWVVAALAVVAALLVVAANRDGGPRDTVSYVTEAARTADLEDVVEGTATLAFADGADAVVRTTVPGVVTDVAVEAGDTLAPLQHAWDWPTGHTTTPPNCRAVRCSASPSPEPW